MLTMLGQGILVVSQADHTFTLPIICVRPVRIKSICLFEREDAIIRQNLLLD